MESLARIDRSAAFSAEGAGSRLASRAGQIFNSIPDLISGSISLGGRGCGLAAPEGFWHKSNEIDPLCDVGPDGALCGLQSGPQSGLVARVTDHDDKYRQWRR
jgi:hypothetical protein